ncbi:hypothetical protein IV02_08425 [Pseudomonas syringae]|uniref:GmrSD restriction endonucleases N-terminal domain-containing protein n=1 Tax=Pseudomonas syringae TaxID=317 RepID=A0A085VAI5_PSESX|nr:hypothetical protein IV02_08425 [Pseudomonas syringae]
MSFFNPVEGNQNIRVVTLHQWLEWAAGHRANEWQVSLPMIQRGFVWKPAQILELWDTLFQGLPIGALLVSELEAGVHRTPLNGQASSAVDAGGSLALVDGQQRTLAMLAGWPIRQDTPISHRLWVDFADQPRSDERVSMRVTTRNQPFGFSRANPNSKLPLADRRKAQASWLAKNVDIADKQSCQLPSFRLTQPWSNQPSLPLDLRDLVRWWQGLNGDASLWKSKVLDRLKTQKSLTAESTVWALLDTAQQKTVARQIDELATGLLRLHESQIPLIRLDNRLFKVEINDNTEPPLALLFKRIGSNATRLSDDDYVYAILKHLRPEVHDLVSRLYRHRIEGNQQPSVASLMSPTDLAMSALRLAAACRSDGAEKRIDPVSPTKEEFHRLIKREGFLELLLPLLTKDAMERWFDLVLKYLEYQGGSDPGLPRHALPYLPRQLVQVLLRLAQVGYFDVDDPHDDNVRRSDVLRLVLYWWLCVYDQNKASLAAYKVIAKHTAYGDNMGSKIVRAIVEGSSGYKLFSPVSLRQRPRLTETPADESSKKARGWSRFKPDPDIPGDHLICEFWQRWHAPHTHRHSILLWLQRSYVSKLSGDPIAKRDEDTPYDYDHILPANHWSGWTGVTAGARFMDYCEQGGVIGNSIGNMRVWSSSDNRSDGAAAPASKLRLTDEIVEDALQASLDSQAREQLLGASAVDLLHTDLWVRCAPPVGKENRFWNLERAKAFERAVEQRALALFESLYEAAGFAEWKEIFEPVVPSVEVGHSQPPVL